ncbi:hypothetical protein BDB01DRAFT_436473 [Pilobolus umbonatus]|nr:hypothetical protein BDB01DRAFT_436473 [Pilobolus umbonatus]
MNLSQENAFLETDNESLQQEINSLTEQNKQNVLEKSRLEESIKELKETISQQQVMASKKTIDVESETSPKEKEEEEEEDEVFVYPADKEEEEDEEEEDEEEEEVFVYRGRDAVITEEEPIQQQEKLVDDVRTVPVDNSESIEKQIQARENKLKEYYEHQIGQLREKIQMTDSKVVRYADLYGAYKEKLMSAEQTKLGLFDEISRLTKEIGHAEDALTTTEVNYQKQVDAMTEYITRLQEELEAYKRRNYNQR